jgi:hypothetical protein
VTPIRAATGLVRAPGIRALLRLRRRVRRTRARCACRERTCRPYAWRLTTHPPLMGCLGRLFSRWQGWATQCSFRHGNRNISSAAIDRTLAVDRAQTSAVGAGRQRRRHHGETALHPCPPRLEPSRAAKRGSSPSQAGALTNSGVPNRFSLPHRADGHVRHLCGLITDSLERLADLQLERPILRQPWPQPNAASLSTTQRTAVPTRAARRKCTWPPAGDRRPLRKTFSTARGAARPRAAAAEALPPAPQPRLSSGLSGSA